jgi:ribosomal protein L37AE/L43A
MSMEVLSCPHCGAPLPARALREVLECAYCGRTLVPGAAARWSDLAPDIEPPEGPYRGDGAEF